METLELPDGEVVTTEDVFLYEEYPYRFRPLEHETYEFKLVPLYWGGGDMDVPFPGREELVEQWGEESRGTLTEEEWEQWLQSARNDERFGAEELDALARELPTGESGLVESIRDALGL
ncbi:hypothetical protein SAMN06269185_2060 [Natronoarchaeum philippinense]|uniref:Uncharacterized protein n=1 Tax=Natronoarchaeum philippinense TaxID=558529 RepID=A0A285NUI9_NATPI|nr:hypothetical protein [Natronoarchaeum philippinense]SNZ13152.1 hypothetical protein SAMN06269185_2060 [Natronoarchaeum philippinense]